MKSKKRSWLICFSIIAFCASGCEESEERGKIIAVVGNESLTLAELMEEIPAHIRPNLSSVELREVVLRWINDQVLYQEALNRKLDEQPELQKEFAKLRKDLLINKLVELTLDSEMRVTEEEIQAYYEANKEGFILSDDVVHAYHILVETQKQANDVRKRLRAGETFEQVAKALNDDSVVNEDWDLGYFSSNEVIPEISKVVFNMTVNSTSFPIKSDFGYHVVKLIDKQKKGDVKKFETVQEEIRHKLQAKKKQEKYQRFLLQMKSKFDIQTNFQLLDSSVMDSLLYTGE